jgi:hypothetical protein
MFGIPQELVHLLPAENTAGNIPFCRQSKKLLFLLLFFLLKVEMLYALRELLQGVNGMLSVEEFFLVFLYSLLLCAPPGLLSITAISVFRVFPVPCRLPGEGSLGLFF